MTKTAIATDEPNDKDKHICPIHNVPMEYIRKFRKHYCKECLHAAFLTAQAQQAAVKRYRQSEKGKKSARKYEQSEQGQVARTKYLKSEKYKQRRREYNQRLRESLQIARLAHLDQASAEKDVERQRTEEFMPLVQDIREFLDAMGHTPLPSRVAKWSEDLYGIPITNLKAAELIVRAQRKRE